MTEVSASPDGNAPLSEDDQAPYVVPATVAPAPADKPVFTAAAVDWDHSGRVVSSRFSTGHVCNFRYDQNGNLYGFTYAKLAWSTLDGANWAARDQSTDWTMAGKVSVGVDGTIYLEKTTVLRSLKLNGNIIDQFPDGSVIESVRPTPDVTAADLMATAHPRAAVRAPQPFVSPHTPAGSPPSGKLGTETVDLDEIAVGRRVVAGGRRMNRLRVVEEVTAAAQQPSLVDEAKSALDEFVTSTAIRLYEMTKGDQAPELAPFLDKLAQTCHRERRVDEARILHERALNIRRSVYGAEHADTGVSLHGLGRIYLEWGRYTESEQYLLDAVKVFEKGLRKARFLLSTEAVTPSYLSNQLLNLVKALHSLASLYHEQGKLHLCSQLHESAVSACNSVESSLRVSIEAPLESLAAMAVQAELAQKGGPMRFRSSLV